MWALRMLKLYLIRRQQQGLTNGCKIKTGIHGNEVSHQYIYNVSKHCKVKLVRYNLIIFIYMVSKQRISTPTVCVQIQAKAIMFNAKFAIRTQSPYYLLVYLPVLSFAFSISFSFSQSLSFSRYTVRSEDIQLSQAIIREDSF